ncbi:MAG: MBL fold metallo-hydrolase [Chitinophagaceae bacterium]
MSLFVASLNSGSNGNCYYVGNREEAILVDAGLSCREIEKRMHALGLDMATIKALFISHEHTDHISGLPMLAKKYRFPVYITAATYRGTGFTLYPDIIYSFTAFEPVRIGALSITAFPKWHDAVDPHSFTVSCCGITAGVFTDIGEPCKNVIQYFKQCHAVFLESNYDEDMLANSRYPVFLRNRISGRRGHLSNAQALQLFTAHRPACMTHIFLSHLSRENNDPIMAEALFNKQANGVQIIHASRQQSTALYHITAPAVTRSEPIQLAPASVKQRVVKEKLQLSLF